MQHMVHTRLDLIDTSLLRYHIVYIEHFHFIWTCGNDLCSCYVMEMFRWDMETIGEVGSGLHWAGRDGQLGRREGMVSLIYLKNGLDMTVCLLCVVNGYSSYELFVFYLSPRSSAVNEMIIGVESILKLPSQILNKKKLRYSYFNMQKVSFGFLLALKQE